MPVDPVAIFLSSPTDVQAERERAKAACRELQAEPAIRQRFKADLCEALARFEACRHAGADEVAARTARRARIEDTGRCFGLAHFVIGGDEP